MNYRVTIGIPVYNAVKYLGRALDTVLNQTFRDIEVLIVDDCSTDNTIALIEHYQRTHPRGCCIRLLHQEVNGGPGVARNRIVDEAQGRFLYFMDADDEIESNTIALLMEHQQRTGADIVYGSYDKIETFNDGKILEKHQYPFKELIGDGCLAQYAWSGGGNLQITIWNFVVNIELLHKARLRFMNSDFWEDMAFAYDLLPNCQHAVLLPDITYHYMCRYDSLSNYQHREIINKEEVLRNILTVEYMKRQCVKTKGKPYQPHRCLNVLKIEFFVLCYILKNSNRITPSFTLKEFKDTMSHPATLSEIVCFRKERIKNLLFYFWGKSPAGLKIWMAFLIGRKKGLV